MKKCKIIFSILILSSIFITQNIFAGTGNYGTGNGRILGMANTGNALFAGYYSSIKNPATLLSNTDTNFTVQFSLPNLQLGASTALRLNNISKYFDASNNVFLTENDKNIILDDFNSSGGGIGRISSDVNVNLFNIAINMGKDLGVLSFSINDIASFKALIPKDLPDLALNGNEKNKEYSFNDLNANTYWYRTAELGYAYNLIDEENGIIKFLNVGAQFKYIMGNLYMNYSMQNSRLYTSGQNAIDIDIKARQLISDPDGLGLSDKSDNNADFSFNPQIGSGFGVSFGMVAELDFGLVVGLSMTDIGSIKFNKNVEEKIITKTIFNFNDISSKEKLDELDSDFNDSTLSTSEFSMDLPTTMRVGLMAPLGDWLGMNSELNTYLDLDFGANNIGTNSNDIRFSLGIDYNMGGYMPRFMTGISNDINGRFRWSTGIGYETSIFDIYLSTYDIISAIAPDTHFSVGLAMRWKI